MKKVYICFSTDIIHTGHINLIEQAARLGEVTAGVLCDECVEIYEKYPLIPQEDRIRILQNIKGISHVVLQKDIFYDEVLEELKPDFVMHGDNWKTGYQKSVREKVIEKLKEWGGDLVEPPYYRDESLSVLGGVLEERRGFPEARRQRLRYQLKENEIVRILEAHDGLSALVAETASVAEGKSKTTFDGIWISSLCDSTIKGKPDIELVDLTARLRTVDEIMEVTTKPIIFDADTGGQIEHFIYNIRTLERVGVSAVIIEDKKGLKRNSLLGNEVEQHQEDIHVFCEKIRAGKQALLTKSFMIIARLESLVLDQGLDDALKRAQAYVEAGADAVMIHSKKQTPDEVFAFCDAFRSTNQKTPIVAVPTTYHTVYEEQLREHGVNLVIYANHLLRSALPAMQRTAESILRNKRASEADEKCMSVKEILSLIPFSNGACNKYKI